MNPFEYVVPTSLPETFALLDRYGEDARLIAGGTALVILMKQRLVRPTALISLGRLPGLDEVRSQDGSLELGALATHRAVETSTLVRRRAPVLAETFRRVATIRIRNVATVGGSLAHADPNQDPPVTLFALDASVELASAAGSRTVPLTAFFTDYYETALRPGEIVTAVRVPVPAGRVGAVYTKFLPRTADDYATVAVCAVVGLDESGERFADVRVGLGAVGSTPLRATEAEGLLRGQPATADAIRAAAATVKAAVDPISDVRGSAEYKRDMAEVWTRRTLEAALEQARGAPAGASGG
jgi:aerobic carbon-monoxide dehydrogenase medium subunit